MSWRATVFFVSHLAFRLVFEDATALAGFNDASRRFGDAQK
jgi:hypothetical protein